MASIIRRLREMRGLTQRDLGKALGVTDKAVSTWEQGHRTPRGEVLLSLAAYFDVPVEELLKDELTADQTFGRLLDRLLSSRNLSPAALADGAGIPRGRVTQFLRGTAAPTADELARLEGLFGSSLHYPRQESNLQPLTPAAGRSIPVLGRVPAGVPVEAVADVVTHIDLAGDDGYEYFALLVKGDSMLPEYRDGDVVVVRLQPTADTGDDVVAYVGDSDATLKRFAATADGIELRPLNPAYPILQFSGEEVKRLPITLAGVVVEQRRRRR